MKSDGSSAAGRRSFSEKMARNTAYNLFGAAWGMLLTFVTMPFIVHRMGTDQYGLLVLVMVVAGYFTFLDLGMGVAIIKYLAERRDGEAARERDGMMIGTALTANAVAGAIGAAALALGAVRMAAWVGVPDAIRHEAVSAFRICSLIFFINMLAAVFLAIPQSQQRFDVLNRMRVAVQTIQTAGIVGLLALGHGLMSVLWLFAATAMLSCVYYMLVSRRLMPRGTRFTPVFDTAAFRRLFSFGFYNTVSKIAALLINQLDRFLIGTMMAVGWISYYAAAAMPAGWILRIAMLAGPVMLPAASELESSGDTDRLRRLLVQGSRYILICCLPLTALLVVMPEQVLRLWMGAEFAERGAASMLLLAVGSCCQGAAMAPAMVLMGIGMARLIAVITLGAGAISTGLCILLIPRLGITGAAAAYAASMAAMVAPLYVYSCIRTRCGAVELLNNGIGRPLLAGAVNLGVLWIARSAAGGRAGLILVALAGVAVYAVALVVFKAVNADDIALAKSFLERGKT